MIVYTESSTIVKMDMYVYALCVIDILLMSIVLEIAAEKLNFLTVLS